MASPMITSPITTSLRAPKRKKSKKQQFQAAAQTGSASAEWKSSAQQQAYSAKLLQALRNVRIGSPTAPRRRAIREAADRTLAVAAKGKTRWSRAILQTRLKLKFAKSRRARVLTPGSSRTKKPRVSILRLKSKNIPAVQRKVKVLGRLVPGCRKEAFPVILEEAADYIAALQMQVRAMSALAELLSSSNSGSGSTSSAQNM